MTTPHRVTRNSLIQMLNNPNPAYVQQVVGRALVVLLNRQTREEARDNTTKVLNSVGFAATDAHSGSISAKYFLKHKKLERWMVDVWIERNARGVPRLAKYWRQLDDEAQRKVKQNGEANQT